MKAISNAHRRAVAAAVRIAVGVVAHKTRRERAERLAEDVGAVVCNVDDGTLACAGNHLQVLGLLALLDADWCVVLEDDAMPVPNFPFYVKRALAHAPAPIVGLYLGTGNPSGQPQRQIGAAMRVARNRAWITADCLIGSVGYAIRVASPDGLFIAIPEMLRWIAGDDSEFPLRVSRFAQEWGVGVCYTVPSLVDHYDGDPIGSTTWPARSVRKAWRFGVRDDWDTPAVALGFCNDWSKAEGR